MKKLFVIAALLAAAQAQAATAWFTGQQEIVQTVTYQMAWRCHYHYLGRNFTAIFQNSCPASIEVF